LVELFKIGGIIFAIWYTRKKKIAFLKAADAFAPGIITVII
jgi:phosphatidylglycerol:prolipoprotein diacylglycerol transferase